MRRLLTYISIPIFLFACTPEEVERKGMVNALVPIYANPSTASQVSVEPARPIAKAGKIYVFGTWLFENDLYEGIHIIDASNRSNPRKVAFLKVPFSTEIAVKGNYLYTNNVDDLLTFDISNPTAPVLVKRVENVFPVPDQKYPAIENGYFECPNPAKGIIVRWEQKLIEMPKCRR